MNRGLGPRAHDREREKMILLNFSMIGMALTEVQLLSFVCSTGGKGSKPRLWNVQNLGAVPPYNAEKGKKL